jgi:DNA (cytosine-5)-methyltransferase 3A
VNVLSLFDGLAGARIALDQIGIECTYYASELDKYAIQIAKKNYPDIIHLGDVRDVHAKDLPKIDLLIGGSPCQDLSVAKSGRKGLDGDKSGLFWEYVRLLKECKPKWFLLENVRSMPKGDRDIIRQALGVVSPIMINSALLTAQNRKRYYWTNTGVFMQPMDKGIVLADIIEDGIVDREKSYCVKHNDAKGTTLEQYKKGKFTRQIVFKGCAERTQPRKPKPGVKRKRVLECRKDDKSNALLTGGGMVYLSEEQIEKISKQKGAKVNKRKKGNFEYEFKEGAVKFPQELTDKAQTLTTSCGNHGRCTTYIKYNNEGIRKLTPLECERLQGIPDGYTEGVSNTQRYKMIGNGFTIPVIKYLLEPIKEAL